MANDAGAKGIAERVRINVDKRSMPLLHRALIGVPADKQGMFLVHLANNALLIQTALASNEVMALVGKMSDDIGKVGESPTTKRSRPTGERRLTKKPVSKSTILTGSQPAALPDVTEAMRMAMPGGDLGLD